MSIKYPGRGALLTIIRGLPGSGKSTKAIELYKQGAGLLIEPDAGLYVDGVYTYTPERMERVREELMRSTWNLNPVLATIVIPIIYADCLPKLEDVFELICRSGYSDVPSRVRVIDCIISKEQSIKRNIHNVRIEDIERMDSEWEPWSRVQENGYNYTNIVGESNRHLQYKPHSFLE